MELHLTQFRLYFMGHYHEVTARQPIDALDRLKPEQKPLQIHYYDSGWHRVCQQGLERSWNEYQSSTTPTPAAA